MSPSPSTVTRGVGGPSENAFTGCLLGMAAGDSYALPYEGLSPSRIRKLFRPGVHGFFFGNGMISDDTEHAVMTAQALIDSKGDIEAFRHSLARRLRVWIALLPAGVGWSTLRSCVKLWFCRSPLCEGVFSAGNGALMRSPVIGLCCGNDDERLKNFVRVSTRLTHTDPQAERGALAIALAARVSAEGVRDSSVYLEKLSAIMGESGDETLRIVRDSAQLALDGAKPEEFAENFGLQNGVTGYVNHTMAAVIYLWLRNGDDLGKALDEAILLGGDTDTVAAVVGGVIGAGAGKGKTPAELLSNVIEWPMTPLWIEGLAVTLASAAGGYKETTAPSLSILDRLARNFFFALIVVSHGLRRLLPPY